MRATRIHSVLKPDAASFPSSVQIELERRHRRLANAVEGSVLDLWDHESFNDIADAYGNVTVNSDKRESPSQFDVVLCVARLACFPDLLRVITVIEAALAPSGQFFFVEPIAVPGWRGVALATATSLRSNLRGLHLNRDVPLTVRSTNLVTTEIERFTMATNDWPLRHFAQARAIHMADLEPSGERSAS